MSETNDRPRSPIDRAFLNDEPDVGRLLLVRHGQQEWPDPATSSIGDWKDPPLSETGRAQAATVAKYLADQPISAVYSSALKRANDTGRAIAAEHGLDVTVVEPLEEIHFYGKLPADARPVEVLGEIVVEGARERFVRTQRWDSYPESETGAEFRKRVGYSIEGILAAHPGEMVVIACHAGVINAYLADLLDLDVDMFVRPAHASVHRLRFKQERRVVHTLNEHHYLAEQDLLTE